MQANSCIKIAEFEHGWMLRTMSLFGGGKLWLPRESTQVMGATRGSFLRPAYRTLISGDNEVHLYGRLMAFVEGNQK